MQFTVEVALSAGSGLVAIAVALVTWRYRDRPGAPGLVAFNAGAAVWTLGNAFQVAAVTLPAKLFWVDVQYVGIVLIPLGSFAFAAGFAGREELARRRTLAALSVPLAALVVLSWTNGVHGLVRTDARLVVEGGVAVLERSFGPVFWAGWLYTNLLNLVATAILLRAVLGSRELFRRQVAAVVVGALVPWAGQVLFLTGVSPVEPESFFAVSGAAFLYAVARHRFLDVPPVARDAVFELLDDGVVVVDGEGRVVDLNETAQSVLSLDDPVGRPVEEVFADHPPVLLAATAGDPGSDDADAPAADDHAELAVETADGERVFDVRASSLAAAGRSGRVVVLRDVTPLKERERELERTNERLDEFAGVVSHDLRSPLSVATGYLAMAREERDSEHLRRVADAHGRMEALIEGLLALARTDETVRDTEVVPLADLARQAWASVDAGDADLVVETDREVAADPDQLLRALENLFGNAVDHGGATEVRVVDVDGGVAVADDGDGIPPDERADVLEWGVSGSEEGTGLGLAIVQRVVEAHGWTLSVAASDAGGASFVLAGVSGVSRDGAGSEDDR